MISILFIVILSYLAGSIPTAIIVGKLFYGIDIREHGSGNAGGTNAFRVMGWKAGIFVMLVDVGKGVLATYFISQLRVDTLTLAPAIVQIIAGFSAVIGHIWTIFAGFRGGKGVGTAAGMLLVLYPISFVICLGIFLIILVTTRYVSVSSMSAAISLPFVLIFSSRLLNRPLSSPLLTLAIVMAFLVIFTHRSNIRRLLSGTENRIKKLI